jgi:hypothetical protein
LEVCLYDFRICSRIKDTGAIMIAQPVQIHWIEHKYRAIAFVVRASEI